MDAAVRVDDGGGGLVAARLDPEDKAEGHGWQAVAGLTRCDKAGGPVTHLTVAGPGFRLRLWA